MAVHTREQRTLEWLGLVLVAACAIAVWPFVTWVLVAMWTAIFARRIHVPLSRRLGDRPRVAAAVTIAMLALVIVPVVIVLVLLVADAIDLVERLMASDRAREVLQQLVSSDNGRPRSSSDLVGLVMTQVDRAWAILHQVAGTAVRIVIGLVILIAGTYAMLVDGDRWYAWLEHHIPIPASAFQRLADAFVETGRGLFVGIIGAGLAQAIIATILYVVIGVPQPFALGLLTLVFSVVPGIGTATVWLPIAAGLALTGRPGAGAVLVIAGVMLVGTIDNLVRPYLTRRGRLQLPTFIVLVAMFGGAVTMGGAGLLLGPLVVRLTKEVLAILRDQRAVRAPTTAVSSHARLSA